MTFGAGTVDGVRSETRNHPQTEPVLRRTHQQRPTDVRVCKLRSWRQKVEDPAAGRARLLLPRNARGEVEVVRNSQRFLQKHRIVHRFPRWVSNTWRTKEPSSCHFVTAGEGCCQPQGSNGGQGSSQRVASHVDLAIWYLQHRINSTQHALLATSSLHQGCASADVNRRCAPVLYMQLSRCRMLSCSPWLAALHRSYVAHQQAPQQRHIAAGPARCCKVQQYTWLSNLPTIFCMTGSRQCRHNLNES